MIFIDRGRLDADRNPIRPSSAWFDLAATETGNAVKDGGKHKVSDLYRHEEVKKALEELFHRKCAYCEGRLGEEWDVEHYRPKGRVAESANHPGYYWLAYVWTNLYPSCKPCNQRRKDAPTWNDPTTLPPAGKLDQFPLADETKRAADHLGNLDSEGPLLLDPCKAEDAHEKRFIFDTLGGIEPVSTDSQMDGIYLLVPDAQGRLRSPSLKDPRAEATISICHLKRRRLREERGKVVAKVSKMVSLIALAREEGAPSAVIDGLVQLLEAETQDSAYYAGTARYVRRNPAEFAGLG